MKHFLHFILSSFSVLLLFSCSTSSDKEELKPHDFSPEFVGIKHNEGLNAILESIKRSRSTKSEVSSLTKEELTMRVQEYLDSLSGGSITLDSLKSIQDSAMKYISPSVKEFHNGLVKILSSESKDKDDILSSIDSLAQIANTYDGISDSDKEAIMCELTTAKYSLWYWHENLSEWWLLAQEPIAPNTIESENELLSLGYFRASGVVVDHSREVIIGATVRQKDKQFVGCITDYDGCFYLYVPEKSKLTFSYLGYKTKTLTASTNMIVVLEEERDFWDTGWGKALSIVGQDAIGAMSGFVNSNSPDPKNAVGIAVCNGISTSALGAANVIW